MGRWKVGGEVRGELDREEGDRRRQRRRRRGEVDSDELPTLIIWENVAREGRRHSVTGNHITSIEREARPLPDTYFNFNFTENK